LYSPGPVACFSDEDDVSGNQNNCYCPLHSESIARCKHHMVYGYNISFDLCYLSKLLFVSDYIELLSNFLNMHIYTKN
jgi:hypothetical protein